MDDFNDPDALDDGAFDDAPPSKSQRKREMHALRDLAERITGLGKNQRAALPLSEAFHRGLTEFDRLKAREAKRRHLSFLGKLMREEDSDAIEAALALHTQGTAEATRAHHALEAWREALLEDGNALTLWLDLFPQTDRAKLRDTLRKAQASRHRGTGDPTAYRSLFRLLRDAHGADPKPLSPPPSSTTP